MTQRDKIIELLETGNWVQMPEFIRLFITRGGAIIHSLRKEGWNVESRNVAGKSYAEYRLISKPIIFSRSDEEEYNQQIMFKNKGRGAYE